MKDIPYNLLAKYFAGECSSEEKEALQSWKNTDTENMNIYNQFKVIHSEKRDDSAAIKPNTEAALSSVWDTINLGESKTIKLKNKQVFMNLIRLAAVLLLFIMVYAIYKYVQPNMIETFAESNQQIELEDGSKISLKKGATLIYPESFSREERRVKLVGIAYFEIAKNPERPFIIDAENSSITVLGTAFNVRALANEKEVVVTVTEGKVAFESCKKEAKVELIAGDQGVFNKQENQVEKIENPDANYMSWKTGKLIFKDIPLSEVAEILSIQFNTNIMIDSELTYNSVFDNKKLDEIIELIALTFNLEIEKSDNQIILK